MRSEGPRLAAAVLAGLSALVLVACGGNVGDEAARSPSSSSTTATRAMITFLELGSRGCVPCDHMQPVMEAIEREFGDQIEVIFYDVREDPAPAGQYGVQYIPTQVFLDENGSEIHRHVGFYPKEEIEAFLLDQGLKKLRSR